MKHRIFTTLILATIALATPQLASAFEYTVEGDQKPVEDTKTWAAAEAQKLIDAKLIPAEHKAAVEFCLAVDKLKRYRTFQSFTYTDADVNQVVALAQFLWDKGSKHMKASAHPMLGATASYYKVKLRSTRAEQLFGKDDPANWNIPKEKEDPKRTYTFKIR